MTDDDLAVNAIPILLDQLDLYFKTIITNYRKRDDKDRLKAFRERHPDLNDVCDLIDEFVDDLSFELDQGART